MVVATTCATMPGPAMHPVATTIGHAGELLVVLVEQGARVTGDVADRCPGELVAMVEPAHARPTQHVTDGGTGIPGQIRQTVWPVAALDPGREDGLDGRSWQRPR